MANQKTERMDKAVHCEMMRLLRERVNDPTLEMRIETSTHPDTCEIATKLLLRADYVKPLEPARSKGHITLAGMDYHRKKSRPIRTWLKANWFAVIVAGCTIGVSIFGIASG